MLLNSFRKFVDIVKKVKVLAISPKQLGAMDLKRDHDDGSGESLEDKAKRLKTDSSTAQPASAQVIRSDRKRKVALMTVYNGAGYCGVQVQVNNDNIPTIESELLKALVKVGCIPQDHADNMYKASGRRVAMIDIENLIEQLNNSLPAAIRVIDYKRVTNGFDAKNSCSGRTYIYMLPTYAFAPIETLITEDYRITDDIVTRVNQILAKFQGTHNFFNYTSGVKPTDPSANRYISSIGCGKPFIRDNIELVIITVKGQSFMLHHIRKIIGQTIAVIAGYASPASIDLSWKPQKLDIPKAPGLGLVLKTLHFDAYNKKYGDDGMHVKLDWSEHQGNCLEYRTNCHYEFYCSDIKLMETVDKFAEEYVFSKIVETEKTDRVMLNWLATLQHHSYDVIETTTFHSGLPKIARNIKQANVKQKKITESDSVTKKDTITDDPSSIATELPATEEKTCEDAAKEAKDSNNHEEIPVESQALISEESLIISTDTSEKPVDSQTSSKLEESGNVDGESSSPKEQKSVRL